MGTLLPLKGTQHPTFRPMSIAAKRSPISATAEHLFFLSYMTVICQKNLAIFEFSPGALIIHSPKQVTMAITVTNSHISVTENLTEIHYIIVSHPT